MNSMVARVFFRKLGYLNLKNKNFNCFLLLKKMLFFLNTKSSEIEKKKDTIYFGREIFFEKKVFKFKISKFP